MLCDFLPRKRKQIDDLNGLTLRCPSNSPSKPLIGKVDGCINVATFNTKNCEDNCLTVQCRCVTCIVML